MPTITHTLQGKVTNIWGTARMRGADGKMHPMHMDEMVRRGDVILTSQDGIVRLSSDEGYPTRHRDVLDRALAALDDRNGAPAAGLNGGDSGNLTPGLRVDRIGESVSDATLVPVEAIEARPSVTPIGHAPSQPTPTLGVDSEVIDVTERDPAIDLHLAAPTGASSAAQITITQLPSNGQLLKADGTPVAAGATLSVAELTSLKYLPPAPFAGSAPVDQVVYSVTDRGATAVGTIDVHIATFPVGHADVASTPEDTPVTGSVLANDTDANGDVLSVTQFVVAGTTYEAGATAMLAGIGSLSIDAHGAYAFVPAANYNGAVPVATYTVSDGTLTSTSTLTLSVTPVNDPPIAQDDQATTPINVPLTGVAVLANDRDVDGDVLHVSSAAIVNPALGSVAVNADGTLNFTPVSNVSGPVAIHYTIDDGHGGTASATLTVTVGPNTAPSGSDETVTICPCTQRAFTPADFGYSDPDQGQSFAQVRIDTLPGAGSLSFGGVPVVGGQSIAVGDLGHLVYTPAGNAHYSPDPSFTFSVQDSAGAFDPTPNTITLHVTPDDHRPVTNAGTAHATDADGVSTSAIVTAGAPAADTFAWALAERGSGAVAAAGGVGDDHLSLHAEGSRSLDLRDLLTGSMGVLTAGGYAPGTEKSGPTLPGAELHIAMSLAAAAAPGPALIHDLQAHHKPMTDLA